MPKIVNSQTSVDVLRSVWDTDKIEFVEQFKIILLNRGMKVLGVCDISAGGTSATVVDPKIVFVAAIKANASAIILAHNHPSGNLKYSDSDMKLTRKLVDGGKLLDISVLDHIILTKDSFYSFADNFLI